MKAERRIETVRVAYWQCAIKKHRHKTEQVASACIKKWPTGPKKRGISPELVSGGYALLLSKQRSGISVAVLARQYNRSNSRIRQLLKRAEELERRHTRNINATNINEKSDISALAISQRTLNCLRSEGINCIDDLVKNTETELLKRPSIGRKSLNDIKESIAEIGFHLATSYWDEVASELRKINAALRDENCTAFGIKTKDGKWMRLMDGTIYWTPRRAVAEMQLKIWNEGSAEGSVEEF